jgi:endoglucanase
MLVADGMFWTQSWNNMQYVTSAAFLLAVESDYYAAVGQAPQSCVAAVTTAEMLGAAKRQVDYILGKNSRGMSYMVGFGSNYPQRVHHRGASIDGPVACRKGFSKFYLVPEPNPFVLEGGIVGGPDQHDLYQDVRENYAMSEPALYNTAPLVGILARLTSEKTSNFDEDSLLPGAHATTCISFTLKKSFEKFVCLLY